MKVLNPVNKKSLSVKFDVTTSFLSRQTLITVYKNTVASLHFHIDFATCGGITVLDLMMPVTDGFDENIFAAYAKTFCECGGVTLQPNFLNRDELVAARENPEKHKNLIVRVCGFSVRFVNLLPEVQDEIINRNYYSM